MIDKQFATILIGGLATPLGLVVLVRLARDRAVMTGGIISWRLALAGWTVVAVIAGVGIALAVAAALSGL